ncbi:MAG: hypothetical protein Q9162_006772 [Coniocarpon cinnabarinum]
MSSLVAELWQNKQKQVVIFSSLAIALYGYDQGMMSLINTNYDYLQTMGISATSAWVGILTSVYYLGCTAGAIIFSAWADTLGRKEAIFVSLATSSVGNLLCFIAGLGNMRGAIALMFMGRVVMGFGVGGIDSVVPIYSSELSEDDARGRALAQEFQMNIFGLNMAFAINLGLTVALGKHSQWAWRAPIIIMQLFPILLMAVSSKFPESPRFLVMHERNDDAKKALDAVYPNKDKAQEMLEMLKANKKEEANVSWSEMFIPGQAQFHACMMTIMVQVNQALTGYGAVSVYGPQIFELLGFGVRESEFLSQGNYLSYLVLMTLAWILIDAVGRRPLMIWNSGGLTICFILLTICGYLSMNSYELGIDNMIPAIPGTIALFVATGNFGIGWLATVWLIPTEIYPTTARAKGTAVSVIVWGIANFIVTLATPIMFNNLSFWIFLVFAVTNLFAGGWTAIYQPETGGRSFEQNQEFFKEAHKAGTWRVGAVKDGQWRGMPLPRDESGEREPLLRRIEDQL